MKVGSLFSGIGGFDLGLERAGMEIAWQCEIDPFCIKVLAKHWPNVPKYGDIKQLRGCDLEPVDLICGGWPCQPFSTAGKCRGKEDDRYLWPEMFRVIQEVKPRWIVGENVANFANMELEQALSDLENAGYEIAPPFIIPACSLGADHVRKRIWIVAHANPFRRCGRNCSTDLLFKVSRKAAPKRGTNGSIFEMDEGSCGKFFSQWSPWAHQPRMVRVVDGIPNGLDRLRALGNAVVPQIVEIIGRAIMEIEEGMGDGKL
jgi:DNA (cytosine-5)-methyltransferase 1